MFIKTKENTLVNLDNIVYIGIYNKFKEHTQCILDKSSMSYTVIANDSSDNVQYILGRFDNKELAESNLPL